MQQGSVGCDGDTAPSSNRGRSPKNTNSTDTDNRIRVKVEVTESQDVFEVKREPQDEYHHAAQHDFPYDRKSIVSTTKHDVGNEITAQCQTQHQTYPRPLASGLSNSYGFPHFYGPPALLPPSFQTARPSPDRSINKMDEHEHEPERYRVPVTGVASDSVFLHHDHTHRFDVGDFHGKGYHGMAYGGFRPTMQQRAPVYGHQNNSGYRAAQYQNRKRKWSGAALRGMPPSMPWPTWFYRPDFPLGTSLPTSHVSNASSVPTSSPLSSRTHSEAPKTFDFLDSTKIHGQTPTICTLPRKRERGRWAISNLRDTMPPFASQARSRGRRSREIEKSSGGGGVKLVASQLLNFSLSSVRPIAVIHYLLLAPINFLAALLIHRAEQSTISLSTFIKHFNIVSCFDIGIIIIIPAINFVSNYIFNFFNNYNLFFII
ncbi:hypothetical protein ANTQUA_LOCUS6095 [Anthophora quadrimaculata]